MGKDCLGSPFSSFGIVVDMGNRPIRGGLPFSPALDYLLGSWGG